MAHAFQSESQATLAATSVTRSRFSCIAFNLNSSGISTDDTLSVVHLSATELVGILDRVGIVAFAFSGVEVGSRRRLDAFGLLVMGLVTATGGGLLRDVILGRMPYVIAREDYLLWAVGSCGVAIALVWWHRQLPRWFLILADAAGLGAFAVAGALAAMHAGLALPAVIALAILTAVGGGVLRDLMADQVPLVLRAEVNATAAALGGLTVWMLDPVSTGAAAILGVAVTALLRIGSVALNLHLPVPGLDAEGKQQRLL